MSTTNNQDYWQQHITAWQTSGQSGAAFCREQNLSYHRFCYWRQKLAPPRRTEAAPSLSGFAKVVPTSIPAMGELHVSLPGGITISGLHADNITLLGAILRQL